MAEDLFGYPTSAAGDTYSISQTSAWNNKYFGYLAFGQYSMGRTWGASSNTNGSITYTFTDGLKRYIDTLSMRIYSPVTEGGFACSSFTLYGSNGGEEDVLATWQGTPSAQNNTITLDVHSGGYTQFRFYVGSGSGSWYPGLSGIIGMGTVEQPAPVWGFNLELQRNDSEPIKLDKSLTAVQTLAGVLRDDCSIENPVFMVEAPLSLLAGCNYVTVPEFGRSYFITDTISVSNELTAIYCRVDVLSSFKAGIRLNKGIVHRQENRWNLYLNDGSLKAYQNPMIDTIVFPQGFSGQSYVLITSGFHGGGNSIGSPSDVSIYDEDPSGGGNVYSKTTAGLLAYAQAQLGKPYWFGTFGNIADQALLDAKRYQYPAQYPTSHDFTADFSKRVHDCVGIVKGYRWSETPTSTPVYNASQDVDCTGLLYQCTGNSNRWGPISGTTTGIPVGAVLFNVVSRPDGSMTSSHCGVFSGTGKVIEARGRDYGVVESNLSDRPGFNYWGIPSWLQISTPRQSIT